MKIYVASSWRNEYYPEAVRTLRNSGFDVYDFRNPPNGDPGFKWQYVDNGYKDWSAVEYIRQLRNPLAERQFKNDIEAMENCDVCVLVLPCGRSAHTEAGWFAGRGKKVICYMPVYEEAELMYKLFDGVAADMDDVIELLKM